MDRGAWRATVHVVARVRHNLATKLPQFQVEEDWSKDCSDLKKKKKKSVSTGSPV